MNAEDIQAICKALPAVTEDVKWGNDLVFSVGEKMFCVIGLHQSPVNASFKVKEEEFEKMSNRPHFSPAPYVARYKWVLIGDVQKMNKKDWERYIKQSYELVRETLPAKKKKGLGLL